MRRFQNISKFRNSVVAAGKKETWYNFPSSNVVHSTGSDPCPIKATKKLVAFRSGSTGNAIGVLPLSSTGRVEDIPILNNGSNVTDLDWANEIVDEYVMLGVGAEDGTVKLWSILEPQSDVGGSLESLASVSPMLVLPAEQKRIEKLLFHPTAHNLLSVASNLQIRLWDVQHKTAAITLECTDILQTFSWKEDGQLLVSMSKDNRLSVFDPRSGTKHIKSVESHNGLRPSRVVWAGETDMIFSTGFNSRRDREYSIWDFRNLTQPLITTKIDTSPGILTPLYDSDTRMLFLTGRGDTNIKWLEIKSDDTASPVDVGALGYYGNTTFSGACLVPKLGLDIMGCEVARILNVSSDGSSIIPISAVVPRKTHADFHSDLFPDTRSDISYIEASEWLSGINQSPRLISLDPAKRASSISNPDSFKSATVLSSMEVKPPITKSFIPLTSTHALPVKVLDTPSKTLPESIPQQSTKINLPKHSAYRYISGKSSIDYEGLKGLSINFPNETDAFQVNVKFIALPISGPGGRVGIWPVGKTGRLPSKIFSLINGADLLDFKFDPFDSHRIITGCDDGRIRIFRLDGTGLSDDMNQASETLSAHNGRVVLLQFHPTALNVILSYSPEQTSPLIKVWDLGTKKMISSLPLPEQALSAAFSHDGNHIAVVLRDKTIRIYESISGKEIQSGPSHQGTKAARILWIGNTGKLISVGYGRANQREIIQYDGKFLSTSMRTTTLDTSPGILIPFFDEDTGLLVLCGRGESTVSFFDIVTETDPVFLTNYSVPGGIQQISLGFLPKRLCNIRDIEILKGFRLTLGAIETISFTVPRLQKGYFQDDIFVPTRDTEHSALTADQWVAGDTANSVFIDLRPADMEPLSLAPAEKKVERKTVDLVLEQTEFERKEASMKAMFEMALEESKQGPLPQDMVEGVAEDEWD